MLFFDLCFSLVVAVLLAILYAVSIQGSVRFARGFWTHLVEFFAFALVASWTGTARAHRPNPILAVLPLIATALVMTTFIVARRRSNQSGNERTATEALLAGLRQIAIVWLVMCVLALILFVSYDL